MFDLIDLMKFDLIYLNQVCNVYTSCETYITIAHYTCYMHELLQTPTTIMNTNNYYEYCKKTEEDGIYK